MQYWHFTAKQQESRRGYRWQQNWRTSKRKISLLCLLPVDGVIQLLHLLISEDAIGEIWLELLQVQLPIIWKERCLWKLHLAEASVFQHLNEDFAHNPSVKEQRHFVSVMQTHYWWTQRCYCKKKYVWWTALVLNSVLVYCNVTLKRW